MVYRLTEDPDLFPDPHDGEPDGLIAVGGDLSVERLLTAYCNGIFPWYGFKEREEILWWCPMERFVIMPGDIHVSHSMRQLINKGTYTVSFGEAFDQVIRRCSKNQNRDQMEGAWLGDDMIEAYTKLHDCNIAQSVEVWNEDNELVGGLYGIIMGKVFIGESMFSDEPNTSKLALIYLAQLMERMGGIIDCQLETPHLKSMGGHMIPYDQYMEIMDEGLAAIAAKIKQENNTN